MGPQRRRVIWIDDESWAEAQDQADARGGSISSFLRDYIRNSRAATAIHARRERGPEAPSIPTTTDRVTRPPFVAEGSLGAIAAVQGITRSGFGHSTPVPKPVKVRR